MDTIVAAFSDAEHNATPFCARVPGEPDPETHVPGDTVEREQIAISSEPALPRGSRAALWGGTAIAAVVIIAGGAFVLSPYNHIVHVPAKVSAAVHQAAGQVGTRTDTPFAPSASLAGVDLATRPDAVIEPKYVPKPRDQSLSEILAMRRGERRTSDHLNSKSASIGTPGAGFGRQRPSTFVSHEPGSDVAVVEPMPGASATGATISPALVRSKAADITPAVIAASAAPAEKVVAKTVIAPTDQGPELQLKLPTSSPVPEARDQAAVSSGSATSALSTVSKPVSAPVAHSVKQLAHTQGAVMSNEDQQKVLELVAQMATMVRDLKQQAANMRADVAKMSSENQERLADFTRRIDFVEASRAVAAAAAEPIAAPADGPSSTIRSAVKVVPASITRPEFALHAGSSQDAKHYRVQAASPGLALLSEVARGGGDGAQVQVVVGDTLPGWGKVKSVSQRGTAWVVSTEHGAID